MTIQADNRNEVADRLIGGSIRRSYDSDVDIDWDAPQDPDKFYLPPEVVSLYGTELWERMDHRQRVDLSRHEAANLLSRGVWFENTLNQGLLRAMMYQDPTSRHVHYALTELGDETRHMIMFGRAVAAMGVRPYRLTKIGALTVNLFPVAYKGLFLWVAALVGEEILDDAQRKLAHHPNIQPLMQQVMRIHVTEEARHIRFAREGVRRRVARAPWWERTFAATVNGAGALVIRGMFVNRHVYKRVGLNQWVALRQARNNELVNARRRESFESLYNFLDDEGLMNPVSRLLWRISGFRR
ncbi:AurF N-oxygenase family protein [Nocardia nepalensis]|uniref:AurF N-oxygenase family protein n=1 Tax=Nocardia nepalensis TaxID=3375448 RepID=UPI003B6790E3